MIQQLSPKQDFVLSEFALQFRELCASRAMHEAIKAALGEMILAQQLGLTSIEDGWGKQRELIGARRFIDILLNVGNPDTDPTPSPQPPGNLLWPKKQPHLNPSPATPRAK